MEAFHAALTRKDASKGAFVIFLRSTELLLLTTSAGRRKLKVPK